MVAPEREASCNVARRATRWFFIDVQYRVEPRTDQWDENLWGHIGGGFVSASFVCLQANDVCTLSATTNPKR